VVSSASGQTPVDSIDWYASRKGCANRTAVGYTGANTLRTIHLTTEMEHFVANYGTPDSYFMGWGSQITGGYNNVSVIPGYGNCNTSLRHNPYDVTNNGNEYFLTGDVGTRNCISRYGARDLIGNFADLLDGYYENLTSTTTRQKSIYWGTADKITTVISDAILGYAVPTTAFASYYVNDWDYQNLLPKSFLISSSNPPSAKFFMDIFNFDGSVATRIARTGYNPLVNGSHLGRFEKSIDFSPTGGSTLVNPRCSITSP
jgi:hypothetical protein